MSASVDGPGTGDGFVLFCEGKTDISDASRQIEDEEATACKKAGIHYVELEIGLDGITVMTNPANDGVDCLNKGDLYALFGPESDGFDNWSDANELATAGRRAPELPRRAADDRRARRGVRHLRLVHRRSPGSRTGRAPRGPEDKAASLRPDYQSSPNDNVIIQGIEGSDSALGFVGFAYADQQGDSIKKLQIDGGDGCVEPSAGDDLRRHLPAVANAVHLREHGQAGDQPGARSRSSTPTCPTPASQR